MRYQPLCFVLMPFGSKPDPSGGPNIDFDRVYDSAIKPGIDAAQMQPIRADEEELGGIIHRAMFERLLVCSYALADLTTSNPNVLYELGVRHTARPGTTLMVYAKSTPLPFDVRMLRTQPYGLGDGNQFSDGEAATLREAIAGHLVTMRKANRQDGIRDSPLFELVPAWNPRPLPPDAADSFRAEVRASEQVKDELDRLRTLGQEEGQFDAVRAELEQIRVQTLADGMPDAGIMIKLLLVHRSIGDWSGMIDVYEVMPPDLARQAPVRQQYALAYNRRAEMNMLSGDIAGAAADRARALSSLLRLEKEQGPNSETSGLVGRIYKSQWLTARDQGDLDKSQMFLDRAVDAYVRGFETDWHDVYPGINAVTLLEAQGDAQAMEHKDRLLPVVRFAAEQRLRAAEPDYWDYATMLEVLILTRDAGDASDLVRRVLAARTESWQPESTADNLRILESVRLRRGEETSWLTSIIDRLSPTADR